MCCPYLDSGKAWEQGYCVLSKIVNSKKWECPRVLNFKRSIQCESVRFSVPVSLSFLCVPYQPHFCYELPHPIIAALSVYMGYS